MKQTSFLTTVACGVICEREGKILMVRERQGGKEVWNQPVGHLEPHETLFEAAIREAQEETGLVVELTGLLGVYVWQMSNQRTALRFCFIAKVIGGELAPKDERIVAAAWLTRDELSRMEAEFRNPLTKATLEDYFAGKRSSLDVIVHLPPTQ